VEIKSSKTLKTIELLKTHDEVKEASVYGAGIHAMTKSSLNLNELENFLMRNQVEVHSIRKIKPTLEDVFVFLVEKEKSKIN